MMAMERGCGLADRICGIIMRSGRGLVYKMVCSLTECGNCDGAESDLFIGQWSSLGGRK